MRIAAALMLVVCLVSPDADAGVCVTTESDLLRLIDSVSVRTGLKFVIDPRVRAQITLAGLQDEDVTFDRLKAILTLHDFTALESPSDQVVYVVPSKVVDTIKPKLGIP